MIGCSGHDNALCNTSAEFVLLKFSGWAMWQLGREADGVRQPPFGDEREQVRA